MEKEALAKQVFTFSGAISTKSSVTCNVASDRKWLDFGEIRSECEIITKRCVSYDTHLFVMQISTLCDIL